MRWNDFMNYEILNLGGFKLLTGKLLLGLMVFVVTWFVLLLLKRAITKPRFIMDKIDTKRRMSIYLIIKYFIWVISIIVFLDVIGVKLTVLLVGSTALLALLGLGLQNIFTDLVSGLFLLFEGTIKIGDILEVDGVVGRVKEINLRSTELMTRDDMTIIMPNSRFIVEKVVNWSHNYEEVRFKVGVGVAYGSDVDRVVEILKKAMSEVKAIAIKPVPFVRLVNFGDSSIEFEMIFWSKEPFVIENTKSELRMKVYKMLAVEGMAIPFPQRDVHIKGIEKLIEPKKD